MAKSVLLPLPGRLRAAKRGDAPSLRLPILLTLPTLIVVFVVFGIPLIYSLALSLHRINMLTQQWIFVGLQNYLDILPNPDFVAALGRTAYFALVTVIGGLILGFAMALVLNQSFPGRNFLRSVVLVPWAMAPVAVGVLWSWMLNGEYGTFNAVLFDLGLVDGPIHWLADGRLAFNMVALAHRVCRRPACPTRSSTAWWSRSASPRSTSCSGRSPATPTPATRRAGS
jgi:ABC-type sugar transport system permease subunit